MSVYVLTGAAGFIGSVVAAEMLRQGHTVFGVDNLNHVYDVRVKEHRLQSLLLQENFHFIRDDITDRDFIARLSAQVPAADAVINLAAIAGVRASTTDPWSYLNTNTLGNLNMLEYARHQHVPKFILASTSSLYGNEGKPPHAETASTEHPLAPYAASKMGAEAFAYAYHHLYGIDISVLRYFTVPPADPIWSCSASANGLLKENPSPSPATESSRAGSPMWTISPAARCWR